MRGSCRVSRSPYPYRGYLELTGASMTKDARRHERSAGSRSGFDVIRSGFRQPNSNETEGDIESVRDGSTRIVSCSLRGPRSPYPKRSKQGNLQISHGLVTWSPSWGLHRRKLTIDEKFQSIRVLDPGKAEWNSKKGGSAFGVIPIPKFQVLECQSENGVFEFTVPQADIKLVELALRIK